MRNTTAYQNQKNFLEAEDGAISAFPEVFEAIIPGNDLAVTYLLMKEELVVTLREVASIQFLNDTESLVELVIAKLANALKAPGRHNLEDTRFEHIWCLCIHEEIR